jgi:hypothetical protein
MSDAAQFKSGSQKAGAMIWTGRVMSGLLVAFLAFDTVIKLIRLPIVAETMVGLGWPPESGFALGVLEAAILILYVIPRTSVLGAVLMTGLLGGAMATHIRIGSPLFSHVLFGLYMGLFAWIGLWLRNPKVRELLPLIR